MLKLLPSRERGLKSSGRRWKIFDYPWLPSRERGLKSKRNTRKGKRNAVAPFAGAWIEIWKTATAEGPMPVAPFAGAWIEILFLEDDEGV